jgi:hypothetical protein
MSKLTLVEAQKEAWPALADAFARYVEQTKHLGANTCITSVIGGKLYARSTDDDLPWLPLLHGAANFMSSMGESPIEIRGIFERFLTIVVEKQDDERAPRPDDVHPFEWMRAIMIATIDELMPALRPMHEFDAIVARAGSGRRVEDGAGAQLLWCTYARSRGQCGSRRRSTMSKDDPFPNLEDLALTPEMLARLQKGGQIVNPFRPGALRLKYYLEKVECEHCGTRIYGDQKAVDELEREGRGRQP